MRNSREYRNANKDRINETRRIRYAKDKPRFQEELRRQRLRRQYGITVEQYDELLQSQNRVCAICRKECSTGNRLAVDHCHATGKVRGLLCYRCNTHLGWLEQFKENAMGYLFEDLTREPDLGSAK